MDNTNELPTVLSLCTGYGGIERGLELAGFEHRVVAHVEIEAFAIANLVAKMEEGRIRSAPIWSNLKTLPLECFRGRVDVLTGGYPCQPFSAAGQRKGKDDPRHLWPYISDIIKAVKPFRCFFENVEGHISLGLKEVIGDLESLGYQTTWGIFSAAEVGAPHQRKRVYILASSRDWDSNGIYDSQKQGISEGQDSQPSGVCTNVAYSNGVGLEGVGKNSNSERWEGSSAGSARLCNGTNERNNWEVEPGLGRVADGVAHRVDRLRLLGNGVVPQQAAKAFLVLNDKLNGGV